MEYNASTVISFESSKQALKMNIVDEKVFIDIYQCVQRN